MVHRDETVTLISADKASGTDVYDPEGETLGEVRDVMIDKKSGRVAYAIMSYGGVLGMGKHYFPLPWSTLTYDADKEGYVVALSKDLLRGGPNYDESRAPMWDRTFEGEIHSYYGISPYWW